MSMRTGMTGLGRYALLAGMFLSTALVAQEAPSECVERGALAFDDWTKTDSGGSGLPMGVMSKDYIRCKACHGWDRMGVEGGYVRRGRNEGRPNAGAGDGNTTPREILSGSVTEDLIMHTGIGRSYSMGRGSWMDLDEENPSAANTTAHHAGYTEGNMPPDWTMDGMNMGDTGPTDDQVNCLMEFLNFADGDPSVYFDEINPSQDPVLYTMVSTADAAVGELFYEDTCEGCHEAPEDFVLPYLEGDGKFSELAQKARWGSPDTAMTRENMGDPTSQDIADLLLYLQQEGGTGLTMNEGMNGNWNGGDSRKYEGFQLEIVETLQGLKLVISFYGYDSLGNRVWLFGDGLVVGDTAEVNMAIYDGTVWGAGFDPSTVNEVAWGTAFIKDATCDLMNILLQPNEAAQDMGFTDLQYDVDRVVTTSRPTPCPMVYLD